MNKYVSDWRITASFLTPSLCDILYIRTSATDEYIFQKQIPSDDTTLFERFIAKFSDRVDGNTHKGPCSVGWQLFQRRTLAVSRHIEQLYSAGNWRSHFAYLHFINWLVYRREKRYLVNSLSLRKEIRGHFFQNIIFSGC